ncbi:hypothetical protein [Streptomyces canus]
MATSPGESCCGYPAAKCWSRDWAVSRLLLEHLSELDPLLER